MIVACKARVVAVAVRPVMQQVTSTGRVPVMSMAKVHVVPAVDATLVALSTQGPLSRPRAPAAVAVVEILEAVEAARPVVQQVASTREVLVLLAKIPVLLAVEAR